MLFNSIGFIFAFLPAVIVFFYALPAKWRPAAPTVSSKASRRPLAAAITDLHPSQ